MAPARKLQTPHFGAIPPYAHHAITTHMPGWDNLLRIMEKDVTLLRQITSIYPRMMLHRDIESLNAVVVEKFGKEGEDVLLFSAPESVTSCQAFVTSPAHGLDSVSASDVTTKVLDSNVRLYAIFFPELETSLFMRFWMDAGVGISSRLAESALQHLDLLHEVLDPDSESEPKVEVSPADAMLRDRIAGLLERAPVEPARAAKVKKDDVYLFQTGMSAIYTVYQYLLSKYKAKTVLFGFAFHSTPHVLEDFGPGYKFFGLGTADELVLLEAYLEEERKEGRKTQALWAEFPANPLLVTPDLAKLKSLADEYGFLLVVDDTLASFCNVDLLGVADIVVSSLTKSFSGYADVMAASAVLNPSAKRYEELKELFERQYVNRFWGGDAEALEVNSRDYLERSMKLNRNTETLVGYLQNLVGNKKSSVKKVYCTNTSETLKNYKDRMRPPTADFTPGFGCLFSVKFKKPEAIKAFYNNLNVHQGPHLGAHLTLALPYVKCLYGKDQLDWAQQYDLRETQCRISVGLEDTKELLATFKAALEWADAIEPELWI
ncbi:uncharacterized protein L3040_005949 [Drepanopeziza brunnea f. sp. 'multigermtubi']|uniref:Cystathionine gamma-synthase n=1 Tax=Marssonina brunnea f. sp. multigermtubi (strain MB_m1) TaxID=1072389 RepID=K1X0U3_MARBU|nr:cystathionine gamma-synthase [Drepanopeziza brunnea f. sp. 'multigermtubi' MB_m1]EKD18592.1 cystathionine gamma-synthase [Drepanopeziza brunnea f. sp. 'multigermtubi' MB_m1]KAJ5040291.1 hypothetical protein L3040_005949 [Drepanopeziza brunnea f. sp. 'multigermtubi']